jgi:hypothetical protein
MTHPAKALSAQRLRKPLVTRAEASLAQLAAMRDDDLAETAHDLGIEALSACTAYTLASTPREMADASRRIREVAAKRRELLERVR